MLDVEKKLGVKFMSLAEWGKTFNPPPKPTVVNGRIVCGECGKPADTFHFLRYDAGPDKDPWEYEYQVVAACPEHDPGGYWLYIEELAKDPFDWLCHLNDKADNRVRALLWALQGSCRAALRSGGYRKKPK